MPRTLYLALSDTIREILQSSPLRVHMNGAT